MQYIFSAQKTAHEPFLAEKFVLLYISFAEAKESSKSIK
jgi:hypothetical protein